MTDGMANISLEDSHLANAFRVRLATPRSECQSRRSLVSRSHLLRAECWHSPNNVARASANLISIRNWPVPGSFLEESRPVRQS